MDDEIKDLVAGLEELDEHLSIDSTKLHVVARQHVDLINEVGKIQADLKAAAKRAKIELDEIKAKVYKQAKEYPEQFGISKPTEAAVKSAVDGCSEVITKSLELIEMEALADKAYGLFESYRHRKSMIQEEIKLFTSNLWEELTSEELEEDAKAVIEKRAFLRK